MVPKLFRDNKQQTAAEGCLLPHLPFHTYLNKKERKPIDYIPLTMFVSSCYSQVGYATFLIATCLCLAACDPARTLVVKNQSHNPARFSMPDSFGVGGKTTLTKILAPKGQGRRSKVTFYYGLGGWDDRSIEQFTRHTAWLELASSSDTLRLQEREQIQRLLQDKRQGVAKSRVVLKIH